MWDLHLYLGDVWSGSGRLPDRVQTASPSGCGWPCTGHPETHTPAGAPSSRSTPSCASLWLYILHSDATRDTHTHTMRFHFDVSFHLHTCVQLLLIHTCRCLVLAAEQLLLEQLGALLKGTSTVEGKVFCHQLSRFPKPIQHILSYDLCNRIFCPFFFYTKTEV